MKIFDALIVGVERRGSSPSVTAMRREWWSNEMSEEGMKSVQKAGCSLLPSSIVAFNNNCARRAASSSPSIHNLRWKRDVVYLYQFPRPPVAPNLSPFALKVETFLRVKGIKYEAIGSFTKKSKYGLIPFVELNGEHIPDSSLIIQRLTRHFDCPDVLSESERGVGYAVDRMLDSSTMPAINYDRIVKNSGKFMSREVSGAPVPAFISNFLGKRMAAITEQRTKRVFVNMSEDDIRNRLRSDLHALDRVLGDKRFLFGDVPSAVDCSVFGHLAVSYYLPYRQPLSDYIDDHFPHLKKLISRIRAHYFPEWTDDGYKGK